MTKYSIEVDNDNSCVELVALLQEAIEKKNYRYEFTYQTEYVFVECQ